MPNLDNLFNPDNRTKAFEQHQNGLLVSLAGPGTGKTFSLLKRVKALGVNGVLLDEICYLTFIKEIANSFIEDYDSEFGGIHDETDRPIISTLHSFACRIIRNLGYQIGYNGELFFENMADENSDITVTILEDLLPFLSYPFCKTKSQLRKHLCIIKQAWRDNEDPNHLANPISALLPITLQYLQVFRFIDWDQAVPNAYKLLTQNNPLPEWINRISHYLIDEFQDFNKAEQELILFLISNANSSVIVGDDYQSLFSSRGGSPDGIRNLFQDPKHDQVTLIKCYRCKEKIVQAANNFQLSIQPNEQRQLVPCKFNGSIISYRFKSAKSEFAFLSQLLNTYIEQLPDPPKPKDGSICLFPSNKMLDYYFLNLSQLVPCIKRKYHVSPERLWLEHVLHLIIRPNQRFLQRLLLNHVHAIKPRHKNAIIERMLSLGCDLSEAINYLIDNKKFSGEVAEQCRQFCNFLDGVEANNVSIVANWIASKLILDYEQVKEKIEEFMRQRILNNIEMDALVSTASDNIYPQSVQLPDNFKSILFLTMHSSKGLTRRNVVLPGLEEAWLPGMCDLQGLAEKQRLFYVAITRATDSVIITYPKSRSIGDPMNYDAPGRGTVSPFVTASGISDCYHE